MNQKNLTNREKEILNLIAQGLCSKQIAARLIISENRLGVKTKNALKNAGE